MILLAVFQDSISITLHNILSSICIRFKNSNDFIINFLRVKNTTYFLRFFWVILNLLAKPKNEDHVSCLHLKPPLARWLTYCIRRRRRLGIFSSPKAYIGGGAEEIRILPSSRAQGKARNFSKSRSLYRGGEIGIFLGAKAYMEETVRRVTPRTSLRSVLRQQAVFEVEGSSEFFQVPGPIQRGKDRNFSQVPKI